MTRNVLLAAVLIQAFSVTTALCGAGSNEERLLSVGVTGSVRSTGKANPSYLMRPLEVQKLLLMIAEEPRDRAFAAAKLEGSDIVLEDILSLDLLREEGDELVINFNFLTQHDQSEILRVSERHANALAEGFLVQRQKIRSILEKRTLSHVSAEDYAYILIGCFSLDWDGLRYTKDPRFRSGATFRRGEDAYTPWAKELGEAVSLKALFWGSHNTYLDTVVLTTFGDHHALPRAGFPDFGWSLRVDRERVPGDEDIQKAAARAGYRFLGDMQGAVGAVMLSLGAGPKGAEELAGEISLDEKKLADLLVLLEKLDYIALEGEEYHVTIPVLVKADTAMVKELLALGREVIAKWHEDHYQALAAALEHLTSVKYGVSYKVVYTEVWHYVFALANRRLIEAGLLADPYAESRRFKGFMPAVWLPGQDRLEADARGATALE